MRHPERLLIGLLLAVAAWSAGAAQACPAPSGGTLAGLSFKGAGDAGCQDPVVIEGARDTPQGLKGERAWLAACRPGMRIARKALRHDAGRTYEVVELRRSGREPERICFDISSFFGVW